MKLQTVIPTLALALGHSLALAAPPPVDPAMLELADKSRCLTHDLWEELTHQIHLFLSSVSLADVVHRRILGRSQLGQPLENGADGHAADGHDGQAPARPTDPVRGTVAAE